MADKKIPAEKYVKKRKNLKLWHRLLLAAGCVVVFVTTYMLILPAITAEFGAIELFDESVSSGSAVTPEEDNFFIEETTEEITEEIINNQTDGSSEETSDFALEETSEEETDGSENSADSSGSGGASEMSTTEADTEETSEGETAESQSEETTEGTGEEGGSGGVTVTYELDETKQLAITEENLLLLTLLGSTLNTVTYTNSSCTYDADNDYFNVNLALNFTLYPTGIDAGELGLLEGTSGYYGSVVIDLPSNISINDDILGVYYPGYITGSTTDAFTYYFQKADDGSYQVVLVFLDSYMDTYATDNTQLLSGNISLTATVDSESYSSSDKELNILDSGGNVILSIEAGDITYPDNSTSTGDIIISKSGSYDSTSNTIPTLFT